MTRKTLKIAVGLVSVLLVALTAGVVVASTQTKAQLPEYVGSEACLGCHSDKYVGWESTHHAETLKLIKTEADLPLPVSEAPAELQAELKLAAYNFRDHRFMTTDPTTGKLVYLGIEFNNGKYVAYANKGQAWDDSCGGCHSGNKDPQTLKRASVGVGCENCHGPGRDHILGKGDISKIYNNVDPATSCASCHSGYNQTPGAKRFPVGYRPGMTLADIGFTGTKVDPNATPTAMHHKGAFPQWQASAHATAATTLNTGDHTQDRCYACHSTTFIDAQEAGQPISVKDHPVNDGVTCVTCHDPHNNTNPGSLKKPAQELCTSCHNGGGTPEKGYTPGSAPHHPQQEMLGGFAAVGIAPTRGAHTEVTCVECHMTDNNHLMKIVEPADVIGTTRKDTCSTCHTDSSPESRSAYLEMWKESITNKLADLKNDIAIVDAALKANPNGLAADLKAKFNGAKTNVAMVTEDKSNGAHNFEYAIKMLTAAKKDLAAAKAALGK